MSWEAIVEAAEAIRAKVIAGERSLVAVPLAGVGWATVEADRARREFDELLFDMPGPADSIPTGAAAVWRAQPRDPALGARAWLREAPGDGAGPWLVVLEPATEGRLAASLARFGEGIAAVYLGNGPYRAGAVRPGGPAWGPHVVVLGAEGRPRGMPERGEELA
jgi:hypothetical protein